MIDCENEIFSSVHGKVIAQYPEIDMTGEYVEAPSSFPHVSLVEKDNSIFEKSRTSSYGENHAEVMYELNVYSNKSSGKKTECKEIAAFIDNILISLNFTRIMLQPIENQNDATIYRMLGRYRAIISKEKVIYRR